MVTMWSNTRNEEEEEEKNGTNSLDQKSFIENSNYTISIIEYNQREK